MLFPSIYDPETMVEHKAKRCCRCNDVIGHGEVNSFDKEMCSKCKEETHPLRHVPLQKKERCVICPSCGHWSAIADCIDEECQQGFDAYKCTHCGHHFADFECKFDWRMKLK